MDRDTRRRALRFIIKNCDQITVLLLNKVTGERKVVTIGALPVKVAIHLARKSEGLLSAVGCVMPDRPAAPRPPPRCSCPRCFHDAEVAAYVDAAAVPVVRAAGIQ